MVYLYLAVFGACGVLTRFLLVQAFQSANLPWAVLIANITGSFIAGFIYSQKFLPVINTSPFTDQLASGELVSGMTWATLFLLGFLGGLTTYSSFSLDTIRFFQNSEWSLGLFNILLNNTFSLLACFLGLKIATLAVS